MEVSTMQVDMAILSILAVVIVFVIGAFKQNPLHLGILGMFVAFVIGKAAGIADTTIMGFFPTTLFVRVFGIMFFFAIAQANGAIELLAKKMIAKFGANARLMPFVLFYVGVILGSIGINSLQVWPFWAESAYLWQPPLVLTRYSMVWLAVTV